MAQTPAQTAAQSFTGRKRIRKFFGHIREVAAMPNLIAVQKASYDQFLMVDEPHGGALFEVDPGCKGLPTCRFGG